MTSISGADVEGSTQLTRRLAVLPTALGIASVLLLIATSSLAGTLDRQPSGQPLTLLAAACVVATIVSGHPVGLYVGVAVFIGGSLAGDPPMALSAMVITVVGLLLVHETARPSLDARRPARFGPGLWLRYGGQMIALGAILAALAVLGYRMRDLDLPQWLVPAGLALTALPLLGRRLVTGSSDDYDTWLPPPPVRVALGVIVAVTAVAGAILGAAARSGIENVRPVDRPVDTGLAITLPERGTPIDDSAVVESGVAILLFLVVMLIAGLLYVAFKRPEVAYDLDELDMSENDSTLGLGRPGQADLDDELIEFGDGQLSDLLDKLALDIGAETDPARAIRFGYANVERRLGEAGVTRSDTETEQEFLARALPSLGPHGGALADLTSLFEHARFGHAAMTEDTRAAALEAVSVLRTATEVGPADELDR